MKPKKHRDSRKKSIAKAFTFRIIATLITIVLIYITTGRTDIALEIGFLDFILKLFFYYIHERAWAHV